MTSLIMGKLMTEPTLVEPTELIKRCHNQADTGLGKVGKALERLDIPSGKARKVGMTNKAY
jgi:hypothetical protein